jgi:pimeloyl-ACP methyl ester carboxylesterase
MGLSTFSRYTTATYPGLVRSLADALELERFAITSVSGGGRYACACAWQLTDRLTSVVLASTTCSFDLPGAKAAWSKEDRRAYTLALGAPWLFRLYFAKLGRTLRRDPLTLFSLFPELGSGDQAVLDRKDSQQLLQRVATEAFRQGARGPAHDYILEAQPWGVPLDKIQVPVEIWHGDDDRIVAPEQPQLLAKYLPHAETHVVPGAGHLLWFTSHAKEIIRSAIDHS